MALPKNIKTDDLVKVFRAQGVEDPEAAVAALLSASKDGEPPKPPKIRARVDPEQYAIALGALEGRSPFGTRTAMVALRQTALAYVLAEQRDGFAGWLEAQTVVVEHTEPGAEPVEPDDDREPAPEDDADGVEDE